MELPSDLAFLDLVHRLSLEITEALGLPENDADAVANAVLEAVGNAMRHGNKQDLTIPVQLRFHLVPGMLSVEIEDHGDGFDLSILDDPTSEENLLKSCGRGFFLMRAFVDSVKVQHGPNGGTIVTLVKSFTPSGNAAQFRDSPRN